MPVDLVDIKFLFVAQHFLLCAFYLAVDQLSLAFLSSLLRRLALALFFCLNALLSLLFSVFILVFYLLEGSVPFLKVQKELS